MDISQLVSSVEGHLGYFQFEAIANRTSVTLMYRLWMDTPCHFSGVLLLCRKSILT
jgi:hypothetical protein